MSVCLGARTDGSSESYFLRTSPIIIWKRKSKGEVMYHVQVRDGRGREEFTILGELPEVGDVLPDGSVVTHVNIVEDHPSYIEEMQCANLDLDAFVFVK